ncbi:hypothetical protein PCANB_002133 [Pneumocystis canis]|nr:hypothetical protein PCK1_001760 [Pneumocystis canis]KAG5439557.1 hypothetical protein PCANB_002133 [Pneumocystis canis]
MSSLVLHPVIENTQKNEWEKIKNKLQREPLVPIVKCVIATCLALAGAAIAIQRKNRVLVNRMFRYRIYTQGFTLTAAFLGSIYYRYFKKQEMQS